jgi:glycosyltransferase involved in cell wall biosynthesis
MSIRGPAVTQVVLTIGGGGLEAMAARLAIELVRRGFPSSVVALDGGGEHEEALRAAGVDLHVLDGRRLFDPRFHWRLARILRRTRTRVLHTHHFAPLLHSYLAQRLAGVRRRVHTEHAFEYLQGRTDLQRALRGLARGCAAFVVVGERMPAFYTTTVGLSSARLRVIPNGIDPEVFAPAGDRTGGRHRQSLPDGLLVGALGRLASEKNIALLIRAFARVLAVCPASSLVLIGDGIERPRLEALAVALGIADRVCFLGWRADAALLLPLLDVYAITSDTEALPLAVLEAMAAGLPVVATSVGDLPDVLDHGRCGLLVRPGDEEALAAALRTLASDADARRRLGGAGRQRVLQRYSQRAMVERYLEAYGLSDAAPDALPDSGR